MTQVLDVFGFRKLEAYGSIKNELMWHSGMKEMLRNQVQNNQFKMSQKFKMVRNSNSGETRPSVESKRSLKPASVRARFSTPNILAS